MSFPARRTSFRGGNRPAQVFKKRYDLANGLLVLSNADAVLVNQIILNETGTVYAVKISLGGQYIGAAAGDGQIINLYVRCVPNDTLLPDLTDSTELETMNGFYVGSLMFNKGTESNNITSMNTKFRFRRKCDQNSQLQLLAQSNNTNGTGRSVELSGIFEAIIRVR